MNISIPNAIQEALGHHQAGRLHQAEVIYQQILQIVPNQPDALHLLGLIAHQVGRNEIAIELIGKAVAIQPSAPMYYNLGIACLAHGDSDGAAASYRKALAIAPDYAEAHGNLGNVLKDQGKLEEAAQHYRKAIAIRPDFAEAHVNLGNVLMEQRKVDAALDHYRQALVCNPQFAEAHSNLADALKAQGELDAAIEHYRQALALKPGLAESHVNLGNALKEQGKLDEAIDSYRKALMIKPEFADAYSNMGNVLHLQGQLDAAAENCLKAIALNPDFAVAHYNLGNVFKDQGKLDVAVASFQQALSLKPDHVDALINMGNTQKDQGKLDAAIECYRRALAVQPDHALAYSNLLFLLGYHGLRAAPAYLAEACQWERACTSSQQRQEAASKVFKRLPSAGRRLRVGYVSGDFWAHPVSYFVEQLFACHDRTRIELFAYSSSGKHDATTARLQALAEHWVPLSGLSDAKVLDRIEADAIDILIDLSGHTEHNRLGVFARRAAPVQAHYLGYFASTGLSEMDYWIGDEILTPPGTDSHFREQVWRLPQVWISYHGKAEAPVPAWRPSPDGSVWLGSFNHLGKLTPATLALWAKVLHALPQGRLLLKTRQLADAGNRRRIVDVMAGHGIAADRIELQDGSATPDWPAHMAYYNRLDIALDPVGGIGGGTTSCDGLWMGVPLVTLRGDRMASRMTASMLNAIGHSDWIADTEAEYVDKIVALARDVGYRERLRPSQRGQMLRSPLCDAAGLASSLESAYVAMFDRWREKAGPV